jgi:hypothetical protein
VITTMNLIRDISLAPECKNELAIKRPLSTSGRRLKAIRALTSLPSAAADSLREYQLRGPVVMISAD